jgi:uncharacterized protein (DUF736 family)
MSTLGRLVPSAPGDLSYLSGHIDSLNGRMMIVLEGDGSSRDQQRPSHKVLTKAPDGSLIQIGAAWLKTSMHGAYRGEPFFTITIDHPERLVPLNVAAFFNKTLNEWVITWRRRPTQPPQQLPQPT